MEGHSQVQVQLYLTIHISLLLLFTVQHKFLLVLVFINWINFSKGDWGAMLQSERSRVRLPMKQKNIIQRAWSLQTHHDPRFASSVFRFLVTANVARSSLILVILMTAAISPSETSVLTKVSRRNIPEDGILHSLYGENLKSYIALTGWTL
jgi:hypothetical protein